MNRFKSWTWWKNWLRRQFSFKAGVEAFQLNFIRVQNRQKIGMSRIASRLAKNKIANKISRSKSTMYLGLGGRAERRRIDRQSGQARRDRKR